MKTNLFLYFFFIVIIPSLTAQTITFDKSLPFKSGKCVKQTSDEGYIIAASNGNNYLPVFSIIKTNKYGYIEWYKNFQNTFANSLSCVVQTNDGGYAAVCTIEHSNPTDYNINLIKFNASGEIEWTKEFGEIDRSESAFSVVQTFDNGFLVGGTTYISSSYKPIFYRTDSAGNTMTVNLSNRSISQSSSLNLVESPDSSFLFTFAASLTKIDSYGNEIWNQSLGGMVVQATYMDSSKIAALLLRRVLILDSQGNTIHESAIPMNSSYSITKNSDDNVLIVGLRFNPSSFLVCNVDTTGQVLFETPLWASGYFIQSTNDGGYIITGANVPNHSSSASLWVYKSNPENNFQSINLITPVDNSIVQSFDKYRLEWHSQNIEYIDIQYSTDGGNSWNNIINFYPAELDTVSWAVPECYSANGLIRIRNTNNHAAYDINDPPVKIIAYRSTDYIAANEVLMWMGNNGMNAHDPRTDGSGFYWPGGANATISAIYEDGLVWGGKVNGEIRVNAATYRQGLKPGYIMSSGLASDPLEVKSKIFKLKKNWQFLPPSAERDRYEFDYINWPIDVGAPWDDINRDGVYTPGIDNPKIFGDETLFFVANDFDTATSRYTYGSEPMGLEFQVTTFGYNDDLLKDVVFKKYKIINKGTNTITDMLFSFWTDDDMGYANDDFVGCDTLLNLGYTYNGDNNDEGYYGTPPPAVGHMFIQSPIIPAAPTDSARYNDGWKKGFLNRPVTSYIMFIGGVSTYADPELGTYDGTLQLYNYMNGYFWNGNQIIDPNTMLQTHFCVPGDPVNGTGWYEGTGWPGGPVPGDRRFLLTSGKLNMAPNDTQEVVIAIFMKKGTDNINSISVLKEYAIQIQNWYDNVLLTDVKESKPELPTNFSLSQNYPNPFNPSTNIQYAISSTQFVKLKVYDLLGREVATLVNEKKPAGSYEVEFSSASSIRNLASGIYFYRLQAGDYVETKKMILMK